MGNFASCFKSQLQSPQNPQHQEKEAAPKQSTSSVKFQKATTTVESGLLAHETHQDEVTPAKPEAGLETDEVEETEDASLPVALIQQGKAPGSVRSRFAIDREETGKASLPDETGLKDQESCRDAKETPAEVRIRNDEVVKTVPVAWVEDKDDSTEMIEKVSGRTKVTSLFELDDVTSAVTAHSKVHSPSSSSSRHVQTDDVAVFEASKRVGDLEATATGLKLRRMEAAVERDRLVDELEPRLPRYQEAMRTFRQLDLLPDPWRDETVDNKPEPEKDLVQSRIQQFETLLTTTVKGRIVVDELTAPSATTDVVPAEPESRWSHSAAPSLRAA